MESLFKEPIFLISIVSFGFLIFVITLINIRFCIIALFFAVALSPKINLGGVPLRIEDFFTIILCFSWFAKLAITREPLPSTSLNIPIFVYLLACFVASVNGYYQQTTLILSTDSSMSALYHFLKKIQIFIIAYLIASNVKKKEDLRYYLNFILISTTILAVYSFQQSFSTYRVSGPVGEGANTLGMFFVFITLIAMGLFLSDTFKFNKLLLGLSILIYLYVVLRSLSRVSYMSFMIVILFLGIFKDKRLLFFAILLLVLVFAVAPPETVERINTIKGIVGVNSGEYFNSWESRKWAWTTIPQKVFTASPLLGFGLASAPLCYAESQYVTDLYFTGILGIIAFIWLCIRIFKLAAALKRSEDTEIKSIALYFMAAFTAFLIGGISGPTFTAIRTANILWIFIGFLAGIQENVIAKKNP